MARTGKSQQQWVRTAWRIIRFLLYKRMDYINQDKLERLSGLKHATFHDCLKRLIREKKVEEYYLPQTWPIRLYRLTERFAKNPRLLVGTERLSDFGSYRTMVVINLSNPKSLKKWGLSG